MKINKRIAALAVAGAMVVGTVGLSASAQAAEITPAGAITITPTSGNVSDQYFLTSIAVNTGAPVGFRAAGATYIYQGGVEMGGISILRTLAMPSTFGTTGLDGNPAFLDRSVSPGNNYVTNKKLDALANPLATGNFELRFYYFASNTTLDRVNAPYVKLNMTYDATSGAWAVAGAPPVGPTATTTSLTAQATGSAVTLAATVAPAAAVGTVSFSEGATVVAANVAVSGGVATANLPTVTDGPHTYTATFTPTVPANFTASTSGNATVTVGGIVQTTNVTTTIAAGAGNGVLTLTGVPATVALGAATLTGTTLNASGTLNAIVTDSRQLDYPAWNLTGQIGDFSTGGATPKILSGKYLGWTPAVTGAPNSVAGAVVLPAPATVNGLKTISTLATGAPNDVEVSNVSALLQLKAPKNTPAGAYSATLTLTLI
ncbi:Ig-like domain repeat protein [Salinibacterium sp.]|uniref:Ig-like domain repeat protein n=1 Tax=Salinibacterium sp. TaxID=1915057 RepID=UPI00286B829A|nr:Ig-like domain repeat protein [Salinibacterium sp.]